METAKYSSANWLTARMADIGQHVVRVLGTAMVDVAGYLQTIIELGDECADAERVRSVDERLQRSGRIRYR